MIALRDVTYRYPDAPAPVIWVDCTAAPEECSRLKAQTDALPAMPRLPSDFPYPELVVKLSRVP